MYISKLNTERMFYLGHKHKGANQPAQNHLYLFVILFFPHFGFIRSGLLSVHEPDPGHCLPFACKI